VSSSGKSFNFDIKYFKKRLFQPLTDKKSEYLVEVNKFFFIDYIVLEYKIQNTLNNVVKELKPYFF